MIATIMKWTGDKLEITRNVGVSNRWTGFSTGTWDWNVGLDYLTGTWDWATGLEHCPQKYTY